MFDIMINGINTTNRWWAYTCASCVLPRHENKQIICMFRRCHINMLTFLINSCTHPPPWHGFLFPCFTGNDTCWGPIWSPHMNLNVRRPQKAYVITYDKLYSTSLWLNMFECIHRLCSHDVLYYWCPAWLTLQSH